MKGSKTSEEKPSLGCHRRLLDGVTCCLSIADALLTPPQNKLRKSQEYEKRMERHFAESAVLQADAFSCTTPKLFQAPRKACLPSSRAAFLLLKAEKESIETRLVSLFDLYSPLQPAGYTPLPFTTNRPKFGTASRKKSASHPCYPRHPWSITALSEFSAAKSPRLRVSPSPLLHP